ncbi:MAG: 3-deoxy-7-phosphoheptulonate synthase [Sphingomicrobium sp.]
MKHNHNTIVTPILPALNVLRGEIDRIDDQILDLLEQRYAVVRRVSRAKAGDTATALPVRPRRERHIVERLSARAIDVPAEDVAHIWRSILSLSARSQRAYRITLWSPEPARAALAGLAAARFGATVPMEWAASANEAIAAAHTGDSILLMPADQLQPSQVPELDLIGQYPLDCLHHPWALAMGRLAAEIDAPPPGLGHPPQANGDWTPTSWKRRVHHQLPAYRNSPLLEAVQIRLAHAEPVVTAEATAALSAQLVEAQQGRRLLIQAGDCAEPIDATRGDTLNMSALIHHLADQLERGRGMEVIRLGRLAGQFAKPRSASAEQAGGTTLPVDRGDAVNQFGASAAERAADPARLHDAYTQSRRVGGWLAEQAHDSGGEGRLLFTSHEALLLNYEAALTRRDPQNGRWWARSAHSLWLGDRTRDPRGAHVEYLRGIANPIGIKCGPGIEPDQLLSLLESIDAARTPGRIMLVARLGHDRIAGRLGRLMEAVRGAGHPALWLCDPMHGNNRTVDGVKTRLVPDLVAEVEQFVAIARSVGVHPGGLHLEITPEPVLECVDDLAHAHPQRPYQSLCDPRLNPDQAMHVIERFAAALEAVR